MSKKKGKIVVAEVEVKPEIVQLVPELPKKYTLQYDYLSIQIDEAERITKEIIEKNEDALEYLKFTSSICTSLVSKFCHVSLENDRATQDSIYTELLKDGIRYSHQFGFGSFQLCVWVSILTHVHQKAVKWIWEGCFSISSWLEMTERVFLEFLKKREIGSENVTLFTKQEVQSLFSYLMTGYVQHLELYKFVFANAQELETLSSHVWIETKTTPFEPLKNAIKASERDEYCRKEKEREEIENAKALEAAAKKALEEKNRLDFEAKEKHSAFLRQQVAEFEKILQTPLPPYPVPAPRMPTVDTLFRKLIQEQVPDLDYHLKEQARLLEEQEKKKRVPKMPEGDLPLPPDVAHLEPLVIPNKKMEKELRDAIELNRAKLKPVIRYEKVPVDARVSRSEAVDIITNNVNQAVEDWKKWLTGLIEYEQQQWNQRIQNLQKAREARDQDKLANEKYQKEMAKNEDKKKKK